MESLGEIGRERKSCGVIELRRLSYANMKAFRREGDRVRLFIARLNSGLPIAG